MLCCICVGKGAGTEEEHNGLKNSVRSVSRCLNEQGIDNVTYVVNQLPVQVPHCDFVFNLCDNDEGTPDSFINFTTYLEENKIPYTGNTSNCFQTCYDKLNWSVSGLKAKMPYRTNNPNELVDYYSPYVLKHRYNHGSLYPIVKVNNINDENVIAKLKSNEYFCEQFIKGKEISISCLPGYRPRGGIRLLNSNDMLDFQTKWHKHIDIKRYEFTEEEVEKINQLLEEVKLKFNINSYMRLDIRLDKNGKAYLIDINPNCSLDSSGAFCKILAEHNVSYSAIIKSILINMKR